MTSTLTPAAVATAHHTLLRIPATTRLGRTLATDPLAAHSTVMSMFTIDPAAATPRAQMRVLFATRHHPAGLELLISSATAPQHIPDPAETVMSGVRTVNLTAGDTHQFQLRAVPTASRPVPAGRGRRYTPRTSDAKLEWLTRALTRRGLAVAESQIIDQQLIAGDHRAGHRITMPAVTFRGQLTVTDPAAAAIAVEEGIGRGRAYGAGLLLLIPTTSQ